MMLWFRQKFSRKLAFAFSLTTLFAVILTGALIGHWFHETGLSELEHSLTTQAAIIETQIDKTLFNTKGGAALNNVARELGKTSGSRVTFIDTSGRVLGDSSLLYESLSGIENHKDRPEIQQALSGGEGHSFRYSRTVRENFLYTAVPVRVNGALVGFVRLAFPLTKIQKWQNAIYAHIGLLSLIALFVSLFAALLLSRSLSRPVTEMSAVAEQLADGCYDKRVALFSNDEHRQLGQTLNTLATRIQGTIQELSRDKTHLSTILSNMEEAVVAVDPAGRITAVNPTLARIFNLDAKATEGKVLLEVLRQSQLNQLIQNVLQDLKPRSDEVHTYAPDERIFEARAVPLMKNGSAAGALLVLHDITRIRRLEQIRRDFVANVSHELRTPLASIKGFAETLRTGALKDSQHGPEFVTSIEKHTDNMIALVEDLLDLTAIESGHQSPMKESVGLTEILREVCDGLNSMAEKKNIKIQIQAQESLSVLADKRHVKQIFANLIDNAIKYSSEAGTVVVATKSNGSHVETTVSDLGTGIPAQDIPRIFERFYRVDKARSRAMGGTGLGLSIVKHLVEANGGSVTVESTVGKGSRFTISLPVHK